jgi:hypothetical protein
MEATLRTLKPIHELTVRDLSMHRVWEYATGSEVGHDETCVCPVALPEIPAQEEDFVVYHVACSIRTAPGRTLMGFMSVCGGELHDVAPVILGAEGGYFPLDCPPTRKEEAAFETAAGAPYREVFPVSWRMSVPFAGETEVRAGTFPVSQSN